MKHNKTYKQLILVTYFLIAISATNLNAQTMLSAPNSCAGLASIKANQIIRYNPTGIKNLLRRGCPPPRKWRKAVNHELWAGGGGNSFSGAVRLPAHTASLGYASRGACYKLVNAISGGKSGNGAIDPCKTGNGFNFFNIKIPFPKIPTIGSREITCMNNLVNQVFNGKSLDVDININGSGICAAGTLKIGAVGQCGMNSSSGKICATPDNSAETQSTSNGQIDVPFSRVINPKYIIVNDILEMKYIHDPLNIMTGIYLPNGGTVTFENQSYDLDAGMFVTMNAEGEIFFGPDYQSSCNNNYTGNNCNIALDAGEFVTIEPIEGVINIDSAIFEGDTLNQTAIYASYSPTNNVDTTDPRAPTPPSNPYDPRINTTQANTQIGPGPQPCLSDAIAELIDIPKPQGCAGSQRVGASEKVLGTLAESTLACPPSVSLFCLEDVNQAINNSAPPAAQQP